MCENGLERTTKTIPVGIFADIRFFHPFSGVEIFGFDFFDENGLQGTTKTIPEVIFAVITFFSPFRGLKMLLALSKYFYLFVSTWLRDNVQWYC